MSHDFSKNVRESMDSYLASVVASSAASRHSEKLVYERLMAIIGQEQSGTNSPAMKTVRQKKKTKKSAVDKAPTKIARQDHVPDEAKGKIEVIEPTSPQDEPQDNNDELAEKQSHQKIQAEDLNP